MSLRRKFLRLCSKLWPFLASIFVVLVFFYPVWLKKLVPLPADFIVGVYYPWLDYKWGFPTGVPVKNPITTDVVSFIYPVQMLAIDLLKAGQFPLWNPYILTGSPLLANFQSAPFSSTNFLYFLFDSLTAWSIQIMAQHFLAIVFTFLLLRYWNVSKPGALFGGLVFGFSGFNLIWSQWNGHTLTAAFIPLILLFVDRWLRMPHIIFGILLSLSLSFQIFSGYPQVVLYTLIVSMVLWVIRLEFNRVYLVKTVFLFFFISIGIAVASPQILPGQELLKYSQRQIEMQTSEWVFLPFVKTITFIAPDFFGNPATYNWWGPQDYTSNIGFIGGVAFILALFAIPLIRKQQEVLFCVLILLLSLLLSYPTPLSILIWKSGIMGFQAASAHRALVLFNLSVALLVGFGVDRFLYTTQRKTLLLPILLPGLLLLGFAIWAFVFLILSAIDPEVFPPLARGIPKYIVALRNLIFPTGIFLSVSFILLVFISRTRRVKSLGIVLVFFLASFELFRFGWKFTPFSPRHLVFPTTPVLEFLMRQKPPFHTTGAKVIPVNLRMPYHLETVEGYDAVYPFWIGEYIAVLNSNKVHQAGLIRYAIVDNLLSPLLDLVNTKYYLVKADNPQIDDMVKTGKFEPVFQDKSVVILENKKALPRAFMVYEWEVVRQRQEVLKALLEQPELFPQKIFLEEESPAVKKVKKKPRYKINYLKYSPQESVLEVFTEQDGFLFISETWYPGWRVYIDDKPTKLYRANFAFRGVFVNSGSHRIRFVYHPMSFFRGLQISALALILLFSVGLLLQKSYIKKIK